MKIYSAEEIRERMLIDNRWLFRGLLAIYSRQTSAEKTAKETRERNGVGFNGCDAPFLTDIAQKYQQLGRLSDKQIAACRKSMLKYCGQLARIANGDI